MYACVYVYVCVVCVGARVLFLLFIHVYIFHTYAFMCDTNAIHMICAQDNEHKTLSVSVFRVPSTLLLT